MSKPNHVDENVEGPIVFDYLPVVSYALYQNHVPVIRTLSVRNTTDKEWANLTIKIEPSDDFAESIELHTEQLLPDSTFQPEIIRFKLKPVFVYSLTEKMTTSLKLSVRADEKEVYTEEYDIDLLAYDQWLGKGILPEMLSAFVMPNLPELVPILKSTASILEKWTDNSALNDYQSQNPDRVKKQMAALYAVIKEKKLPIVVCLPVLAAQDSGLGWWIMYWPLVWEIALKCPCYMLPAWKQ